MDVSGSYGGIIVFAVTNWSYLPPFTSHFKGLHSDALKLAAASVDQNKSLRALITVKESKRDPSSSPAPVIISVFSFALNALASQPILPRLQKTKPKKL